MILFSKLFRKLFYFLLITIDIVVILFIWFICTITIHPPHTEQTAIVDLQRKEIAPDFYTLQQSWIKKSETGLWEIYVEGNGFERGVIEGKLNKELAEKQEIAFVNQIKKMIPSQGMLHYLKFFISFFNRNLDHYIPEEYKLEIYGESLYASDQFDFIAPKYYRMLNYHAAHDIGHALQDKNMTVGCTAFGVWGNRSSDTSLLIGRNFDFYVGDEFAEDKLINFVNPSEGYKLMMISWAGMIGTVSGMNEKGLTVTINASKSEIPTSAATPISIVAREILQYAKNIEEAFAIAQKRKTFVSESILIGSQVDGRTATIEKTPSKTELYDPQKTDYIICANHYQGNAFFNDAINRENIEKSSSDYRRRHLDQLIQEHPVMDINTAASILRNQQGIDKKNIGMGNEKALNQLIAHHSVIFKPAKLQVWVSTNPFQLGPYVCYDLNRVFKVAPGLAEKKEIYEKELTVAADPFLFSQQYKKFNAYKQMKEAFQYAHVHNVKFLADDNVIKKFINCNPEYFETYVVLGQYYKDQHQTEIALRYF
ncbi:MAG TPA: C45 family autoproteolytic acyltransferase/hydrolase, partial [Bacteroidia bacterium]|nr:C45 family autoproteolytic acyltransferase/hydrolase [Bacteroidia bacterium]